MSDNPSIMAACTDLDGGHASRSFDGFARRQMLCVDICHEEPGRGLPKLIGRTEKTSGLGGIVTIFGIGPKLLGWTLAYSIVPAVLTKVYPGLFVITSVPPAVFHCLGVLLLALGVSLWLLSIFPLLTAFTQGRLCTTGSYSIVRNPLYAAYIVFIVPAIALFFRSWILFTIPIMMSLTFKKLIRAEELYLEERFGEEYLKYKAAVNALIPSFRSFKLN